MKSLFTGLRKDRSAAAAPAAASLQLNLQLSLVLLSDVGPAREHNEDCINALLSPSQGGEPERTLLVALADGMGGHRAGEVASQLAVRGALAAFGQAPPDAARMAGRLHAALAEGNRRIWDEARQHSHLQGMGTTLLLFAPAGDVGYVAWVGDSRLYRRRAGGLERLTRDDTLVMGLLERGLIAESEVARHPDHSVLTQAVGTHEVIPSPHVEGPFEIAAGDRFLLCSDGVHDVVSDEELAQALALPSPHESVRAIFDAAVHNGSNDNISIGVVAVAAPGESVRRSRDTRSGVELTS